MSEQTPPNSPKKEPIAANPQIIAAGITAVATILVALITVLPNILPKAAPTETALVIVVTPTAAAVTAESTTAAPPSQTATEVAATDVLLLSATSAPSTAVPTTSDAPPATTATAVQIPNLLLLYDDVSFTVLNQSAGVLSLEGVVFRSSAGEWDAAGWGTSLYNSLPAGMCLRLRDASVGQRQPPQPCINHIYGLIETQGGTLFWLGIEQFDVIRAGTIVATCAATAESCAIYVP
ncbi:MAG: hypothetical protein U0694_18430 [Anaerolineae bacterium]